MPSAGWGATVVVEPDPVGDHVYRVLLSLDAMPLDALRLQRPGRVRPFRSAAGRAGGMNSCFSP